MSHYNVYKVVRIILILMIIGHTPMDVATSWADPRVLEVIQTKWDTLPSMGDKKKGKGGGKGGGKAKSARPGSGPGTDQKESTQVDKVVFCL